MSVESLGPQAFGTASDPVCLDWVRTDLPASWVDDMNLLRPRDLWKFVRHVFGKANPVVLPSGLPGGTAIPKYLLQEFHRMPNGNFSKRMARGYRISFEASMLGALTPERRQIAKEFAGVKGVLDLGCGAGDLAGLLVDQGVLDVWALDPCPYLLKEGAERFPSVNFVQGVAEKMPFADGRFAAVAVSFVFHELPDDIADQALSEIRRVLQPGGKLIIIEPSPIQMQPNNFFSLLWHSGWQGIYYKLLARFVFEPFVRGWHCRDLRRWLVGSGFDLVEDRVGVPTRKLTALRR